MTQASRLELPRQILRPVCHLEQAFMGRVGFEPTRGEYELRPSVSAKVSLGAV